MCSLDYDAADMYNQNDRIARKSHFCSECGRIIQPKEKYRYVFGVWGKDVNIYKTCSHCLVGQIYLWEQCGGYLHNNLEEEIREHAEDYRIISLYRLAVGIKRKWKRFKSDELMSIPNKVGK